MKSIFKGIIPAIVWFSNISNVFSYGKKTVIKRTQSISDESKIPDTENADPNMTEESQQPCLGLLNYLQNRKLCAGVNANTMQYLSLENRRALESIREHFQGKLITDPKSSYKYAVLMKKVCEKVKQRVVGVTPTNVNVPPSVAVWELDGATAYKCFIYLDLHTPRADLVFVHINDQENPRKFLVYKLNEKEEPILSDYFTYNESKEELKIFSVIPYPLVAPPAPATKQSRSVLHLFPCGGASLGKHDE